MDKAVKLAKARGYDGKEGELRKILGVYRKKVGLTEDELPQHYDKYLSSFRSQDILRGVEYIADRHDFDERRGHMTKLMMAGASQDEIRIGMLSRFGDDTDEGISEAQALVLDQHDRGKITLPKNVFQDSVHDWVLWDLARYGARKWAKSRPDGSIIMTPEFRRYLATLSVKGKNLKIIKEQITEENQMDITLEATKEAAEKEEEKQKRNEERRAKREKEKAGRPAPKPKPKPKPPEAPVHKEEGITITPTKKKTREKRLGRIRDEETLHNRFRQLVGMQRSHKHIMEQMMVHLGLKGREEETRKAVGKHAERMVRDKLTANTTVPSVLLTLLPASAKSRVVKDFVRLNTRFEKGRVMGVRRTKGTLKKVLELSKWDCDEAIQNEVDRFVEQQGINWIEEEVKKHMKKESMEYSSMPNEFEVMIGPHVMRRAKKRLDFETKEEVETMFRSGGVLIPDVLEEAPGQRLVLKKGKKFWVMPFLEKFRKRGKPVYAIKTIRDAYSAEKLHYKRSKRR